jgi:hypothetical protein
MPPKGRKHTTTAQHKAVLDELKARKEEAKKLLVELRAKRKMEDKRHSRIVKQAKKLNPKDLLEIAAAKGITADQLKEMLTRVSDSSAGPSAEPARNNPPPEAVPPHVIEEEAQLAEIAPEDYPLVLAELPDA